MSTRSEMIKKANALPKGSPERRELLAALKEGSRKLDVTIGMTPIGLAVVPRRSSTGSIVNVHIDSTDLEAIASGAVKGMSAKATFSNVETEYQYRVNELVKAVRRSMDNDDLKALADAVMAAKPA